MITNVVIGKLHEHTIKQVSCNGNLYEVPFPNSSKNLITVAAKIEIAAEYENCVAIISKK